MTYLSDAEIKDLEARAHTTPIIKASIIAIMVLNLIVWAAVLLLYAQPIIAVILLLQGAGDVSIIIPLWIATFIIYLVVARISAAIEARWLNSYLWAGAALRKIKYRDNVTVSGNDAVEPRLDQGQ